MNIRFLKAVISVCAISTGLLSSLGHAQETATKERLMDIALSGDELEMEKVLDETGFKVRTEVSDEVSLFRFALLCDDFDVFLAVLRHARPLTPVDLEDAAIAGTGRHFLAVLRAVPFTTLSELKGGTFLDRPSADRTRKLMRDMIRNSNIDREVLREEEPGLSDTATIDLWIQRLEKEIPQNQVVDFLTGVALDWNLRGPSTGSSHLIEKYLFGQSGPLGTGFRDEHFVGAFEKGEWGIVDVMMKRGVSLRSLVEKINAKKVSDPDTALGYLVRSQLINNDASAEALRFNRSWKAKVMATFPVEDRNSKDFDISLPPDWGRRWQSASVGISGIVGPCVSLQGAFRGCEVKGFANRAPFKFWTGTLEILTEGFKILIPGSDPKNTGEYHGVTIRNDGRFLGVSNARKPVRVYLKGVLIGTIPVDAEMQFTREFGELEVRTDLEHGFTFGILITFSYTYHRNQCEVLKEKVSFWDGIEKEVDVYPESDIENRLTGYLQLVKAARDEGHFSKGTASASDAKTRRVLLSEQLRECSLKTIGESLRLHIKSLAQQSLFNAMFTSFIVNDAATVGFELPDTLEQMIPDASPELQQQIALLRDSLDKRDAILRLLSAENVKNYRNNVRNVENLLYEFAQYYSHDELDRELRKLLEITATDKKIHEAFITNVRASSALFQIKDQELDGKGGKIRRYLKL